MIGERYGRLTVVSEAGRDKFGQKLWLCQCDCGKTIITTTNRLHMGKTRSCGCLKAEGNDLKHGKCYTRLYRIYQKMKERCCNPNNRRYRSYGGRGITICEEWLGKHGFEHFYEWAQENGYSDNLSIDRIDNDKGYSPENCRWADACVQCNNQRRNLVYEVSGKGYTIAQLSRMYDIPYSKLYARLTKLGWSIERALEVD